MEGKLLGLFGCFFSVDEEIYCVSTSWISVKNNKHSGAANITADVQRCI
ncbi:hypothetical protein SAMN05216464_1018 [Mucilaginibacter pineti]|uniref:Uncharacterized protein n=1 Tax=Mucilaginibacter pineti TaxID=1391627 RepID=A0A1G6SR37_9SPHI|nr:hypothetical protein SAMN05216464_1018 [Mucilaginibacter pineti]